MTITYEYRHLGKPNPVHRATEPATAPIGQASAEIAAPNEYPSLWARIKKVEFDNEQAAARINRLQVALEQVAIVCTQNMDRDCNHRVALDAVRQIANDELGEGR